MFTECHSDVGPLTDSDSLTASREEVAEPARDKLSINPDVDELSLCKLGQCNMYPVQCLAVVCDEELGLRPIFKRLVQVLNQLEQVHIVM